MMITYKTKKKMAKQLTTVSIILFGLLFISPLLWMVIASLKPEKQIFRDMGLKSFILTHPTLENYIQVFERIPYFQYLFNSFLTVGCIVLLGLIVNSLCGYALVKLKFPGSDIILMVIIALYIVPFESVILPLYLIVNKLGMVNTYPALIVPFIASAFNIFLFRQFFLGIPKELEEAAYMDGAGPLRTFFRIVLPLSKPVFATSAILTFITHWSDFMWPMIVTTSEELRTVQIGVQLFFVDPPIRYGEIMAALTLATLPVIIVFLLFQKYYVQGITSSGLKG
ncbi:carbohydrate ABC transporter permease [Geobacillus thermoleovorans]|uniref:carbohydrate ABC transporter permease n=1 Tax=Geobacillus thermoleovorans TaxID=33941 RepID=UPI0010EF1D11